MKIEIHSNIAAIPADQWNALVRDNNPLVRHEFLQAMEANGCVGENFGWLPRHIAVYDHGRLIGTMPLYEKHNSYGEFVFDHAWADAYLRAGGNYYPKLQIAVPFTPATGPRRCCTWRSLLLACTTSTRARLSSCQSTAVSLLTNIQGRASNQRRSALES